jgi:radical SAM protein with 4Fe4S-binding SPASM domain
MNNDFYCAAPWRGLHINPRGNVKTCCAGNSNMLGNLNQNSIVEILNSNSMKEIRSSLAQGIPHEYCSNCVRAEKFGADSERKWHNDVNPNFDYAAAGTEYHYPVIVDVRWNTTCNLSCNYCGEFCSSKWSAIKNIPFKSGARPYYDQVCDFIEQHQEHIREVALVGGEPLLLPENVRLLDVISPDAKITIITNLSINLEDNKIFKKLTQRNKVGWSMSFDNIGSRFEYVRHGSNWELLKRNLKAVTDLMRTQGHSGGIHAVYNMYNATRVCELREFAEEQGVTVLWQNLFHPEFLDPFLHGQQLADLAANEIEQFYKMNIVTPAEEIFFDQALNTFRSISSANVLQKEKFQQHINLIETQYHQDCLGKFKQLWPELEFLCK